VSQSAEREAHVVHVAILDLRVTIPVFSDAVRAVLLISIPGENIVQANLRFET
jgi:hypothetical protein